MFSDLDSYLRPKTQTNHSKCTSTKAKRYHWLSQHKIQHKMKPSTSQFTPAILFVHPKATSGSNSPAYFHHLSSFKIPLGLSSSDTICWRYLPYLYSVALPFAGACVLNVQKDIVSCSFLKDLGIGYRRAFWFCRIFAFCL